MIRIRTKHPDGSNFDGIVLQNAKSLVVLLKMDDFEPNGIVVVPKKWIASIRDGKFEACADEVVRFSGSLKRDALKWPSELDILPDIFAHLKERGIWPAVEILFRGGDALYLGPITEVTKDTMKIYCYDAAGMWEKEYEVNLAEVFKIEIQSRYARLFSEYMKKRKPPPRRVRV